MIASNRTMVRVLLCVLAAQCNGLLLGTPYSTRSAASSLVMFASVDEEDPTKLTKEEEAALRKARVGFGWMPHRKETTAASICGSSCSGPP